MKNWMPLAILMMMSYIGFSQSLEPIVQQINSEPHFCFNREQSKELAKLITLSSYNDSLISKLHNENIRLRLLVKNKDQVSDFQEHQLSNYQLLVKNSEVGAGLLEQKIRARDRKLKRNKTQKFLLGVALVITTTILIVK